MTDKYKNVDERFDDKFHRLDAEDSQGAVWISSKDGLIESDLEDIKSFLHQEIERARKEERKRIKEILWKILPIRVVADVIKKISI